MEGLCSWLLSEPLSAWHGLPSGKALLDLRGAKASEFLCLPSSTPGHRQLEVSPHEGTRTVLEAIKGEAFIPWLHAGISSGSQRMLSCRRSCRGCVCSDGWECGSASSAELKASRNSLSSKQSEQGFRAGAAQRNAGDVLPTERGFSLPSSSPQPKALH